MPAVACWTWLTWSEASREASARTEATLRSAASRISRTWSEVDAANDGAGSGELDSKASATRRRCSSTAAGS